MSVRASRRALLAAVGAAVLAVAAAGQTTHAAEANLQGTITFSGGGAIPAGILKVHLEDPFTTAKVKSPLGETQLKSSGKDDAIPFSLPAAEARSASGTLEVVVRLERKDGWLIGRGAQQFKPGETINVAVNTVQY